MPLQATSGAASYDAFGGGVPVVPNYIEDVFSTYLWTGNGTSQTITNNIDLSTKGGLVWIKRRDGVVNHYLATTNGGTSNYLNSNTTNDYETSVTTRITSFNTDGFSLGSAGSVNNSGSTFVGWTFREQPKFFDVVTYTGTGSATTIAHNLGSVPGCIIVKKTNASGTNWTVYHRSLGNTKALRLNTTEAETTSAVFWNNTTPTSTVFTVNTNSGVNESGASYVAYLWAHDAGGFGLTGTDNVISCGSFTTDGSGAATVSLGYEPQWILCKPTSSTGDWFIADNMRGFSLTSTATLYPNSSGAENSLITFNSSYPFNPTATGFTTPNALLPSRTYIYIAVRRGPMAVPTVGTSVFSPQTATYSANQVVTTGFPVDMTLIKGRTITLGTIAYDRLRGLASTNTSPVDPQLITSDASAETSGDYVNTANNTGYQISPGFSGFSSVNWNFGRAPGFFDEVCYTGTGSATTVTHNLGVVPELMIVKVRNDAQVWQVYSAATGNAARLQLNTNDSAFTASSIWNTTTPTSSVFSVGTNVSVNGSGSTYVAYLFATCAGVSKVGSYTGTATTKQIDCGFTGGARFVLIKKTSGTGSWYVWDSARGIVSGNDPYLLLNSTAAEVTNTDYIDTYSAGFEISSTAPSEINENGGSFIFLAIA